MISTVKLDLISGFQPDLTF